jgi:hypothetical protein
MNRAAVAGAVVALLGIFIVIAVSVVDARRPLDREVSKSFEAVVTNRVGAGAVAGQLGCQKQRPYFYGCTADVLFHHRRDTATVYWRLWLRDDGCWTATPMPPYPPPTARAALGRRIWSFGGCTAG